MLGQDVGFILQAGGVFAGRRLTFGLVRWALIKCVLWARQVCRAWGFREDAAFALGMLSHSQGNRQLSV